LYPVEHRKKRKSGNGEAKRDRRWLPRDGEPTPPYPLERLKSETSRRVFEGRVQPYIRTADNTNEPVEPRPETTAFGRDWPVKLDG
jgi:hypothetical protein